MAGIYIHVPFCEKRCSYCSFYSTIHGKKERDAFVRSLIAEMQHRKTDETIHTVYFGGGTPSQLDAEELELCFELLYGVMLLRLQKKEVSEETLAAAKDVSTFLGQLSDYWKAHREGKLDTVH